jgi:hypothetical protein
VSKTRVNALMVLRSIRARELQRDAQGFPDILPPFR